MKLLESTSGKAHTKDADYAAFTGQVVLTTSATYYDPKLGAWIKRTCEYIDVGRPDAVAPVDADVQLQFEKFKRKNQSDVNWEAAQAHNRAIGEANRAAKRDRIVESMREWGPSTITQICEELSMPRVTVFDLLKIYQGSVFHVVGKASGQGKADIWGLVGIHDKAA